MSVPFLDLKAQQEQIREEINARITLVMDDCAFAGGKYVEEFEEAFANYCTADYAVGCGSGTEALWLALLAHDVGPGDEVITAPNTFFATAEAISYTGASPVFVDVDPVSHNIDPSMIEAAIGPNTKAIMPVHLYGQMADMDPIMALARERGLIVIEDASQAHGAAYDGQRAGSMGQAGCFSFYPGKNLGAYGEAGAVTTNDEALAQRMRALRDHGQTAKHTHSHIGWNCRMDGMQGAVLSVKLKYLPEWTKLRRAHAAHYRQLLEHVEGLLLPVEREGSHHVYHIYAVMTQARDAVMNHLQGAGIGCAAHYPTPVHLQSAYSHLNLGAGSFPHAERCARETLSLPMFAELTVAQRETVAGTLLSYFGAK